VVDSRHISYDEIHDSASLCYDQVLVPADSYLLLGDIVLHHSFSNFLRLDLGAFQVVDEFLVIKNIVTRVDELEKDVVFKLLDLLLVLNDNFCELLLASLNIWSFKLDNVSKQLLDEALLSDCEVYHVDPDEGLRQVVRIGNLGGEVEHELRIVVYGVALFEFDEPTNLTVAKLLVE
jgi:hypothetical protein